MTILFSVLFFGVGLGTGLFLCRRWWPFATRVSPPQPSDAAPHPNSEAYETYWQNRPRLNNLRVQRYNRGQSSGRESPEN